MNNQMGVGRVVFRLKQRKGRPNWYIAWSVGTRSYRVSTGTEDRGMAEICLVNLQSVHGPEPDRAAGGWPRRDRHTVKRLMATARGNARAQGREFSLSYGDVMAMWKNTRGRCSVSGLPFAASEGSRRKNPWAPSLDRIDNDAGYVLGNVRIVCVIANIAMSDWGLETLHRLSAGVVSQQLSAPKTAPKRAMAQNMPDIKICDVLELYEENGGRGKD